MSGMPEARVERNRPDKIFACATATMKPVATQANLRMD